MKKFTFEDYCEALEGAGPKLTENILSRVEQDKNIEFPDFVRLCKMKNKRSLTSMACELLTVLLVTEAAFLWGVTVARAERGYAACGGEYLLLLTPAFYYAGKPVVVDWIKDLRRLWRGCG